MSGPYTGTQHVELQEVSALRETVAKQAERIEALEAGLKPFAEIVLLPWPEDREWLTENFDITFGDVRTAAALLAEKDGEQ